MLIVSGDIQQGKTTFLGSVVEALRREQVPMTGFLARGEFRQGERTGFTLVEVHAGEEMELASSTRQEHWFPMGRFWFNPKAFRWGRSLVRQGLENGARVVVLDEVGPLELQGKGWAPLLDIHGDVPHALFVAVVRTDLVREVLDRWKPLKYLVVEALPENIASCVEQIMEYA